MLFDYKISQYSINDLKHAKEIEKIKKKLKKLNRLICQYHLKMISRFKINFNNCENLFSNTNNYFYLK